MTNGMPVVLRAHFKPIATLHRTLMSIDLVSGRARRARYQRSDVCIVPRASAVLEAVLALTLAEALCETFCADMLDLLLAGLAGQRRELAELGGSGAVNP